MPNEGDEKKMSTVMNQKYSQLKVKLDQISKDAKLLKSKDGMIVLDPTNRNHQEWYEKDEYKGD